MFGYVVINKPELKVREFELYRSHYCGLCRSLKKNYGFMGQLTLNYDMVFMSMVLSDLYDAKECTLCKRCGVHPMSKHRMITSEISDYCSDINVILAYYKCVDDWQDERKLSPKLTSILLKPKVKKAITLHRDKADEISKKLSLLGIYEKANDLPVDKVAHVFGEILGTVFAYREDMFKDDLYRLGFYLGKYIYLLDAYEDVDKDIKSGDYNPFKEWRLQAGDDFDAILEFDRKVYDMLLMMVGEASDAFERLPLIEHADILRNILYSGLWSRYAKAKSKLLALETEDKKVF